GGRSPGRLEVAEGDERASEVREARDTGLVAAERVEEVEGDQEPDEPLCLDREDAPDVDRVVRPVDGECDHAAVDGAGGTRDRVWEEDGEECAAEAGDEIELQELTRAPPIFEWWSEEEQDQHVEEEVEHPDVDEHVGDGRPDEGDHRGGGEHQVLDEAI